VHEQLQCIRAEYLLVLLNPIGSHSNEQFGLTAPTIACCRVRTCEQPRNSPHPNTCGNATRTDVSAQRASGTISGTTPLINSQRISTPPNWIEKGIDSAQDLEVLRNPFSCSYGDQLQAAMIWWSSCDGGWCSTAEHATVRLRARAKRSPQGRIGSTKSNTMATGYWSSGRMSTFVCSLATVWTGLSVIPGSQRQR
jgi:hypothetical protein